MDFLEFNQCVLDLAQDRSLIHEEGIPSASQSSRESVTTCTKVEITINHKWRSLLIISGAVSEMEIRYSSI